MAYMTKEFCKICNVGRETLRHYEQLGFLQPKINPDNHYRSYDSWDASIIADIKRYQSLGFSLEEIKTILSKHDLTQLITSVENRVFFYHEQIQYFQMLCKKSEEDLDILQCIPQLINHYTTSQIPSLLYVPDKDLKYDSFADNMNNAMNHLDFFTPCIRIDRCFTGDEIQQDYSGWGLITQKEYADYFTIHNGINIPASKTVCTIIDAGEKGNISKKLFDAFYAYIEQITLEKNPTIYAYLLTRTHDKTGGYHRYLYTFFPTQVLTDKTDY